MKTITFLFGLLLLVEGIAGGAQADPRGTGGIAVRQSGDGDVAPQGNARSGPPPEAFKACVGKAAGTKSQFTKPDGETVAGTCVMDGERLVLRPDRPRDNARDGRRGPPPEAYQACEGKRAGSKAQFVSPHGETVKGTCEAEEGKLVLRPDVLMGDRQDQVPAGSGKGRVAK